MVGHCTALTHFISIALVFMPEPLAFCVASMLLQVGSDVLRVRE